MRPKGSTRAKKPIQKREYERLMIATRNSKNIKDSTRVKLQRAFTLLYLTGCRVSEIANFTKDEMEMFVRDNEFSLKNDTKSKKPRLISLDDERVQSMMLRKILPRKDKYLFAKNNSTEPMRADSLKLLMNTFIHKILGELYSTHSFRQGYVTTQHKLGFSLEFIRKDIGHVNISTTARYATVTPREIASAKSAIDW